MDAKSLKLLVGRNIKRLRNERNLTQQMLAESIGISPKQIASIECGNSYPRPETLCKLCDILDVPPSYFYQKEEDVAAEKKRIAKYLMDIQSRIDMIMSESANYALEMDEESN